jgi:hypothetical protein
VSRRIRRVSKVVVIRIHRLSGFCSFFLNFYLRDLLSIPIESVPPMLTLCLLFILDSILFCTIIIILFIL